MRMEATTQSVPDVLRYVRTPTRPSRLGPEPDYGELSSESYHFVFPTEEMALTAVLSPEGTMTKSQIAAVQNKEEFLSLSSQLAVQGDSPL